jgi:GntR family transcriptional regulator
LALELSIATGSSLPIYRQITDQVCMAIATGQLAPGDPLPSVRAVAERLVVNPNTVARAYADLARDGRVVTQPGKGLTVAPRRQMLSDEERERRLEAALDEFVRAVAFLDFGPDEIRRRLSEKLADTVPLGRRA